METRLRVVVLSILIIIIGVYIGFILRARTVSGTSALEMGLNLSGGIELIISPDYRLKEAELVSLGAELKNLVQQNDLLDLSGNSPRVELLGSRNNGRFDGLVMFFDNVQTAQQAQRSKVIPGSYNTKIWGAPKLLDIVSTCKSNIIELRITLDPGNFPADIQEKSLQIITERLAGYRAGLGLFKTKMIRQKNGQIRVLVPGVKNDQEVQSLITSSGRMTFQIDGKVVLDGYDLKEVSVSYEKGIGNVINFRFIAGGARLLADITKNNVGKTMSVYLDDTVLIAPVIKGQLPDGRGRIEMGNSPKEEVYKDALLMKSGALPLPFRVLKSAPVSLWKW